MAKREIRRALVFGGGGFIGSHLADRLAARGYWVDIVDTSFREPTSAAMGSSVGTRRFQIDLTLAGAGCFSDMARSYDLVFHMAAIVGVQKVLAAPYRVLVENVQMLETALHFCKSLDHIGRFVFASTSEVHAGSLTHGQLRFPTPPEAPVILPCLEHPRTSYMLSKVYGEALIKQSGLPCTIARPYNIYGPKMGMQHVIPELLKRAHDAKAGGRLRVYSADHRRTFCYIDDAVETIIRLAKAPAAEGETFNIGMDAPEYTMRDVAELVVKTVGRDLSIEAGPETPGSPVRRCPDIEKTASVTGFRPVVGLVDGLRRTFDWYRNEDVEHGFKALTP